MWAHYYIFLLFFSLPPRVSVLPVPTRERALWREEENLAGKPGLEAWVFTPSRPDLGGPERGCGLEEERGRQGLLGAGHRPQPGQTLTHLSQQWLFIGLSPKLRRPGEGERNPGYGNCSQERASWVGTLVVFSPSRCHSKHPGNRDLHPGKCHGGF